MWLQAISDPFRCMPQTLFSSCSSTRRLVAWLYHACVLAQSSCLASWISGQCDSQDLTAFGHFGSERITKRECSCSSDASDIASVCRLNSVRNFHLHSPSAFECICVCGSYFDRHTLSWGHPWSLWLGCACSDMFHTLFSLAICLTMRTAIFNQLILQTRLICPPLRLVCLPACVAKKAQVSAITPSQEH